MHSCWSLARDRDVRVACTPSTTIRVARSPSPGRLGVHDPQIWFERARGRAAPPAGGVSYMYACTIHTRRTTRLEGARHSEARQRAFLLYLALALYQAARSIAMFVRHHRWLHDQQATRDELIARARSIITAEAEVRRVGMDSV